MKNITVVKSITPRDTASLNLYLKDISQTHPLSSEEEIELAKKIQNGDTKAKDKLVVSNLRFCVTVAKQYQNRGLPLEDLIAEAQYGLIKAAEKFNPDKKVKFISYAVWWIKQSIIRAIFNKGNNIRLPTSQIEPLNLINKVSNKFEQEFQRKPTICELTELTNLDEDKIKDLLTSTNYSISLNTPATIDEECSIGDIIVNPNSESPDENLDKESLILEIRRVLNKLNARDHDIICMYYGIYGIRPMAYEEIGKKFALTGERIRQIKLGILKKFKTDFKEYFNNI